MLKSSKQKIIDDLAELELHTLCNKAWMSKIFLNTRNYIEVVLKALLEPRELFILHENLYNLRLTGAWSY